MKVKSQAWRTRSAVVALLACGGLLAGCGEDLNRNELAEYDALTERLRDLCDREGPLEGRETPPALRMVMRMMELTKQAPDQRWVIDAEAGSDGATTPALRLLSVQEILGDSEDGRKPACNPFLAGRVEQFLVDMDYFDF